MAAGFYLPIRTHEWIWATTRCVYSYNKYVRTNTHMRSFVSREVGLHIVCSCLSCYVWTCTTLVQSQKVESTESWKDSWRIQVWDSAIQLSEISNLHPKCWSQGADETEVMVATFRVEIAWTRKHSKTIELLGKSSKITNKNQRNAIPTNFAAPRTIASPRMGHWNSFKCFSAKTRNSWLAACWKRTVSSPRMEIMDAMNSLGWYETMFIIYIHTYIYIHKLHMCVHISIYVYSIYIYKE